MCGFAGFIDSSLEKKSELLRTITRLLSHRGPDEQHFHEKDIFLGHCRLRVIDLASGRQPMSNEDGTVWIVFNGEIYNFLELRKKLEAEGHRFKTQSDTEVIVHLYETYPDFVSRLDGMFSFAIWNQNKKELILARDRLGKKPLYYYIENEKIYFASELKALLLCPHISKELDPESLYFYLSLNYVPGEKTLIRNIFKLEPGHILRFQDAHVEKRRYWQMPAANSSSMTDPNEALEKVQSSLEEAIRKRLMSDVPLGVFLSGGIDSSLVLALLHRIRPSNIHTFSIGFDACAWDESQQAKRIAQYFGTQHHEFIAQPKYVDLLPKIIWHSDEPCADPSCFPSYLLSKFAKDHISVALTGDGGDEFFGGYNTYAADEELNYFRQLPLFLRKLFCQLSSSIGSNHVSPLLRKWFKFINGSLLSPAEAHLNWSLNISSLSADLILNKQLFPNTHLPYDYFHQLSKEAQFTQPLDLVMYLDQKTYLTDDILVKVDRMSMAHGVEARCPLLDPSVIDLAYQIPSSMKLRWNHKKILLRNLLSRYLPQNLISRRKKGFNIPLNQWLRNEFRPVLCDSLRSRSFKNLSIIHEKDMNKMLEDHLSRKKDYGKILWAFLVLAIWNDTVRSP